MEHTHIGTGEFTSDIMINVNNIMLRFAAILISLTIIFILIISVALAEGDIFSYQGGHEIGGDFVGGMCG